ncbi:MAG TPA: ISNCY family transposase, partial [Arsenophonus sp.]
GFIRTLAEKAPTYREDFMTIAEQLEAKGEARGEARGYQLGRQDANKELAKQLLADGVERKNIKRYTGLSDGELDKL